MKVSVVVPVYNGERTIGKAVDALLAQTLARGSCEIIVVDDCSTDGTRGVLAKYGSRIRLVRQARNGGPGKARNAGLGAATGEIVAFTDSDCIPDPDWLANGLRPFADKDVVGVSGRTYTEREKMSYLTHYAENESDNGLYPTCNMLYRRAALQKVGGFAETIPVPFFEDTDLAWRVLEEFPGRRMEFARDAGVFHPCVGASLRRIIRIEAEFREYDALVFRKHRELFARNFMLAGAGFVKKSSLFLAVPLSLFAVLALAPALFPLWLALYLLYVALYFRGRRWRFEPKSAAVAFLTLWLMPLLKEYWVLKGALRYGTLLV
jgi:glycosyltransferase involved in cell wall biosynthesis